MKILSITNFSACITGRSLAPHALPGSRRTLGTLKAPALGYPLQPLPPQGERLQWRYSGCTIQAGRVATPGAMHWEKYVLDSIVF